MKQCPKCGATLKNNVNFCDKCGQRETSTMPFPPVPTPQAATMTNARFWLTVIFAAITATIAGISAYLSVTFPLATTAQANLNQTAQTFTVLTGIAGAFFFSKDSKAETN